MNFTPQFHIPVDTELSGLNRLKPISSYMTPVHKLVCFSTDQSIGEVIEAMLKRKISGAPVLNDNQELVGMISEKDCLRLLLDNTYYNCLYRGCKVREYMSTTVTTVSADASVLDVANQFIKTNFRRFPVVQNGLLVGQVSRRDILRVTQAMKANTWQK